MQRARSPECPICRHSDAGAGRCRGVRASEIWVSAQRPVSSGASDNVDKELLITTHQRPRDCMRCAWKTFVHMSRRRDATTPLRDRRRSALARAAFHCFIPPPCPMLAHHPSLTHALPHPLSKPRSPAGPPPGTGTASARPRATASTGPPTGGPSRELQRAKQRAQLLRYSIRNRINGDHVHTPALQRPEGQPSAPSAVPAASSGLQLHRPHQSHLVPRDAKPHLLR